MPVITCERISAPGQQRGDGTDQSPTQTKYFSPAPASKKPNFTNFASKGFPPSALASTARPCDAKLRAPMAEDAKTPAKVNARSAALMPGQIEAVGFPFTTSTSSSCITHIAAERMPSSSYSSPCSPAAPPPVTPCVDLM